VRGRAARIDRLWGRTSAYTRPGSLRLRIELSDEAGERFGEVTGGNIGRRLAMLIDGRVVSAPVIRDRLGPRAIADIPLDASVPLLQEEAERLAAAINEADSGSQLPPGRR
jgi:preprotein translocase subunit SecD